MSEQESKKTESEIEQVQDEELNAVSGGIFGITIWDRCSSENPNRDYVPALCNYCDNMEKHKAGNYNQTGDTQCYCGKAKKVIYTYKESGR